jgi:hypothetical protein
MDPLLIVLPIIEEAYDDVPVTTEVPRDRPERLVVVTRAGGSTDGFVATPLIGVTCWGRDDHDAQTMARYGFDALAEAAEEHPNLFSADLLSLSRDEWTATGQARYYAEITLTINE